MQADLFSEDDVIVPGLGFRADFITPAVEQELISGIEGLDLPNFLFQGWISRRRTRSFGFLYDFTNSNFGPTEPIPDFLQGLKTQAAEFSGVDPEKIVQVSIIKYEPGAGIGWHRDRPELDAVIGISLGSSATMRFRKRTGAKFERASVFLPPRSVYHLDGEVRHEWEHSIAPGAATRWSITFRGLSENGLRKAGTAEPREAPKNAPADEI